MAEEFPAPRVLNKEYYDKFMDKDGISKDWILTESPYVMLSIISVYLLFVLKLGPAFMKDRQPYKLKNIMRIYNLIQVLGNGYIIYKAIKDGHLGCVFNSFCRFEEEVRKCENSLEAYMYSYWYFIVLKIMDLLDTVFFILRKKMSHVSFLHVYHHASMVIFSWYCFYFFKTPQSAGIAIINVFIHTIMYGYYFLATFRPLKRFLWWKRHLTKLQLIQFAIVLIYLSYLYQNECDIAPAFTFLWMFNTVLFAALFLNFYVKSYILNKNK